MDGSGRQIAISSLDDRYKEIPSYFHARVPDVAILQGNHELETAIRQDSV